MNGEKVTIWKKVVMAYLMALYQNLFGEIKKNYKNKYNEANEKPD
jgi:hypothetical protein